MEGYGAKVFRRALELGVVNTVRHSKRSHGGKKWRPESAVGCHGLRAAVFTSSSGAGKHFQKYSSALDEILHTQE